MEASQIDEVYSDYTAFSLVFDCRIVYHGLFSLYLFQKQDVSYPKVNAHTGKMPYIIIYYYKRKEKIKPSFECVDSRHEPCRDRYDRRLSFRSCKFMHEEM